jgi:hypothetical protein
MKRFIVKGFGNHSVKSSAEEADIFEQLNKKRREQARQFISAKYIPQGNPDNCEFRTTMELQYEFREMMEFSASNINEAMNELGFQVQFLDDKPNWVLYKIQETDFSD